jgi:hypothetical protein
VRRSSKERRPASCGEMQVQGLPGAPSGPAPDTPGAGFFISGLDAAWKRGPRQPPHAAAVRAGAWGRRAVPGALRRARCWRAGRKRCGCGSRRGRRRSPRTEWCPKGPSSGGVNGRNRHGEGPRDENRVLGTGSMADALATHWVRAGHQVTVGGRDAAECPPSASSRKPGPTGLEQSTSTLPPRAARRPRTTSTPAPNGSATSTTSPTRPPHADRQAPAGRVVKAFDLFHEDVWRMRPPVFEGRPLAVPVCGRRGGPRAGTRVGAGRGLVSPCRAAVRSGWGCWRRPPRCSSLVGG